jgi:hypothetical protein
MRRQLVLDLERRLILALGLAAGACSCKAQPDAPLASADAPAPGAAASAHVIPQGTTSAPLAPPSPSSPSASAAAPPPSATAPASATAPPSASASAPRAAAPVPQEPGCAGGYCTVQQQCIKAPDLPPPKPMAPPFERCAPYTGMGTFSASRTTARRATQPDACCYAQVLYKTVKGRPLPGPQGHRLAPLRLAAGWLA